jgi:hypothetical protein
MRKVADCKVLLLLLLLLLRRRRVLPICWMLSKTNRAPYDMSLLGATRVLVAAAAPPPPSCCCWCPNMYSTELLQT